MIEREVLHSKEDATIKYVLESQGNILEFNLIRKGDGKDIVCVPTQTSCNLGCKFCFLTGSGLPVRNLSADEIVLGIEHVILKSKLPTNPTLLVSFMGSGEPLANYRVVVEACKRLRDYPGAYKTVRFGLATIMPRVMMFREFIALVEAEKLPIKVHLSLHSPFDAVRQTLMPAAERTRPSMMALHEYAQRTGNPTELHYTLIEGKNDHEIDIETLAILVKDHGMPPVKFLAFRERPDAALRRSQRTAFAREILAKYDIVTEDYSPPGNDIGASCGQFTMKKYVEAPRPSLVDSAKKFLAQIKDGAPADTQFPGVSVQDVLRVDQGLLDGRSGADYETMEPYPELPTQPWAHP